MKPRLLDLFCGAGGAAVGYARAGFEIVGVDIEPQPNYPFDFVRAGAMWFLKRLLRRDVAIAGIQDGNLTGWVLEDFDAIHASPPCQAYSIANNVHGHDYPRLIEPVRELLKATGLPYVIENVPGAPLENPYTLCGLALGLNVKRHRLFETNFPVMVTPCPKGHPGDWLTVFGHSVTTRGRAVRKTPAGHNSKGDSRTHLSVAEGREAMGIDWMTRDELSEAIPPAYTEHIGSYLIAHLKAQQEPVS